MPACWIAFFRFHGLLLPPAAGPDASPALLFHRGLVWDADRTARTRGIRPGLDAAAARTVCPAAESRTFDPAAAADLLTPAWDTLATAASTVEPDPDGRPEAYAAWPEASPPLPELRTLTADVRRAFPHVDLSVGLGGNRLTARAACPPDAGFAAVAPGGEARFLAPQPLQTLVDQGLLAPSLHRRLAELGLHRCGQAAALPEAVLQARFGREGRRLRTLCLGQDGRPVSALHPPRAPSARRAFSDGLPPGLWPEAAAHLAGRAGTALGPAEGARSLVLCGAFGERRRTWKAPQRAAGILARAAAELARRVAETRQDPTDHLEVRLEGLAAIPISPLSLLPLPLGSRRLAKAEGERTAPRMGIGRQAPTPAGPPPTRDASGAPPPQCARSIAHPPQELDALLSHLPCEMLRRGSGAMDRYEHLLSQLDPWREAR